MRTEEKILGQFFLFVTCRWIPTSTTTGEMEQDIELEEVVARQGSISSDELENLEGSLREADDEQQYQRDWQDPESDDDIVLPAARMGRDQPKRKNDSHQFGTGKQPEVHFFLYYYIIIYYSWVFLLL